MHQPQLFQFIQQVRLEDQMNGNPNYHRTNDQLSDQSNSQSNGVQILNEPESTPIINKDMVINNSKVFHRTNVNGLGVKVLTIILFQ